ncbi:ribosome hibernation-promoting factor, HPF/YfiA family [Wohlfahrtiimonas chitiniclastica]|uniref:ribosome hibernation-promoting factor, HPF/YfiA family n=1 Tax=Wohlfahrtiimonas chitiniclastica TaxID=400946 RepID=UPI000B9949F8|nr:ribosome-associated translation inhibitor RaiA [Wohlfahrtiimonas chitiniclastica]OYQ70794.1 ribosomal subunit interface protein [Wohlfahrtiimonas chitiniclastica]OYQ84001.1 ribosomal subunit interface protein [Wohlfahrtiimonas chitiniclastica]OYQ84840.1 ribosomal subunit interface protein [Wohlfahrtiimonas chitiniclastica]
MNINITGDGLELTAAIQEHVKERLSKIERHRDQITQVDVVLSVENKRQKAEISMNVPHAADINAEATTDDLYVSIDEAVNKLEKQYLKMKDKAMTLQRQRQEHEKEARETDEE